VHQIWLTAIGKDKPGIVARIAQVLVDHGLNIEDSQMSILRGRFTMTLIVAASEEVSLDALRRPLAEVREDLGLDALSVEPVSPAGDLPEPEPSHIVTVYGVDHPGIVAAVTAALAAAQVNITDLETRLVSDSDGEDLYAMMLEVAPPAGASAGDLEAALEGTRGEQGVEVSIRELERDAL
jgi:glycine cleavage system transcriptional repressor